MRNGTILCIVCIVSGAVQLAFAFEELARGATVSFQEFSATGMVATVVGVAGLLFVSKAEGNRQMEYGVGLGALATAILTMVLAFYLGTLGYGSG